MFVNKNCVRFEIEFIIKTFKLSTNGVVNA